jgi:hypothetical protein
LPLRLPQDGAPIPDVILKRFQVLSRLTKVQPALDFLQPVSKGTTPDFPQGCGPSSGKALHARNKAWTEVTCRLMHPPPFCLREEIQQGEIDNPQVVERHRMLQE